MLIQRAEQAAVTGCGGWEWRQMSLSPPKRLGSEGRQVQACVLHVLGMVRGGMIQETWLIMGIKREGIFVSICSEANQRLSSFRLVVGWFRTHDSLQLLWKKDSMVRAKAVLCIERSLEYFSRKQKLILISWYGEFIVTLLLQYYGSVVATEVPAYSDTLGTWKKCHCNQIVTITRGSLVPNQSFGTCQKCHCKRGVTVNSVTVSGEICIVNMLYLIYIMPCECTNWLSLLRLILKMTPLRIPHKTCKVHLLYIQKRLGRGIYGQPYTGCVHNKSCNIFTYSVLCTSPSPEYECCLTGQGKLF